MNIRIKYLGMQLRKYYVVIFLIIGAGVFFSLNSEGFLTWKNWQNLILQSTTVAIAATGLTFVMLAGNFDLSGGAIIAFVGVIGADLVVNQGMHPLVGILVTLLLGGGLGAINGWLVSCLGLASFITTLATMTILRGVALNYTRRMMISGLPSLFRILGTGSLWEVPIPILLMLILYLIGQLLLSRTVLGYHIYVVGGDQKAAHLSGIEVKKIHLLTYIIAGVMYGAAALVLTRRVGVAMSTSAEGLEMTAMSAIVIGGCSLYGGRGSLLGTYLGVLLMTLLENGANLLNMPSYWVQLFQGGVILIGLLTDKARVKKHIPYDRKMAQSNFGRRI